METDLVIYLLPNIIIWQGSLGIFKHSDEIGYFLVGISLLFDSAFESWQI